jgi:hypothetical protein
MRVKIRGGTVTEGEPPLCQTCRYATIVKGRSLQNEIVECQELMVRHGRITFPGSPTAPATPTAGSHPSARWRRSPGSCAAILSGKRSASFTRRNCATASGTS